MKFLSNARFKGELVERPYYGMNISRRREPLDQFDFLFMAKRLRLPLIILVAGKYGLLNGCAAPDYLAQKELKKKEVLERMLELTCIEGKVILTDELWRNSIYWDGAIQLLGENPRIIDNRSGPKLSSLDKTSLSAIFPTESTASLLRVFGEFPASGLYTLFEVAEALYLQRMLSIDCKIGPESEERYDGFISEFMSIIQLCQPLDLKSVPTSIRPLIPYMENRDEDRVFICDSKSEVLDKVYKTAQRTEKTPLYWETKSGSFQNPFVRLVLLALEGAENCECLPLSLRGRKVYSSYEAISYIEKSGSTGFTAIAPSIAEALWNYLIRPMKGMIA